MATKSDFGNLSKQHIIRTNKNASKVYQIAKDRERSGSRLDADIFLKKYGQIYLEAYISL